MFVNTLFFQLFKLINKGNWRKKNSLFFKILHFMVFYTENHYNLWHRLCIWLKIIQIKSNFSKWKFKIVYESGLVRCFGFCLRQFNFLSFSCSEILFFFSFVFFFFFASSLPTSILQYYSITPLVLPVNMNVIHFHAIFISMIFLFIF